MLFKAIILMINFCLIKFNQQIILLLSYYSTKLSLLLMRQNI